MIRGWLQRLLGLSPASVLSNNESLSIDADGITHDAPTLHGERQITHWPWARVHEFGLFFDQAIYDDPWYGSYMETEWFFAVEADDGTVRRHRVDVDCLPFKEVERRLQPYLPGLDVKALAPGWAAHRKGDKNLDGGGMWWGWRRPGWAWPSLAGQQAKSPTMEQAPTSPLSPTDSKNTGTAE